MSWWDIGSIDGVCGDGPADIIASALLKRGQAPKDELFTELSAALLTHRPKKPDPHKRLDAIHVTADGAMASYAPANPAPAWATALVRDLGREWKKTYKRDPSLDEVVFALEHVLAPALDKYTTDGRALERIAPQWVDDRGPLSLPETLGVLRASLVLAQETIPGGKELSLGDLTTTFDAGTQVTTRATPRVPTAIVEDFSKKLMTRLRGQHGTETKPILVNVIEQAVRSMAKERERFTLRLDGVAVSRIGIALKSKQPRVHHPKFGGGLGVETDAGKIRVIFDNGIEKVLLATALTTEIAANTAFEIDWTLPDAFREVVGRP